MTTTFHERETVLCYHGPMIYEARILKAEYWEGRPDLPDGSYYFVHYLGWKQTWDEWVPESRVLELNAENKKKQIELQSTLSKKSSKSTSEKIKPESSVQKDLKRRRDSILEKENEFLKKPEIKLSIPESLKAQLVEDWEAITKNKKLIALPATHTISEILTQFQKHQQQKMMVLNKKMDDSIEEIIQGLKLYFEKAIGNILLYRFERQQYVDLCRKFNDKPLCDIYGVEHLLRLFVQLPTLIAHTNMDQEAINILKDHLCSILDFFLEQQDELFTTQYESASPEYLALQKY
ncbi:MRG-domain-containing protein [Globomyces pollinis-pini]|nr:MRG-domain-containing protein [Globomyces pollinis-pini]